MYMYICNLYPPLQYDYTPLHLAARGGHTACVDHFLSTPGIDVNIKDKVRCSVINSANTHLADLPGSCYRKYLCEH